MLRSLQRSNYVNILRCTSITCPEVRRVIGRNCRTQNPAPTKLHWVGLRKRFYSSTIAHMPKDNLTTAIYQHVDDETIYLLFNGETEARYPFVWLRDNCQCSECHDKTSLQRTLLLETLDIDVKPIKTEMDSTHQSIIVHWSDKHRSEYSVNWLKNISFPSSMDPIDGLVLKYWGSEMTRDKIPTFSFLDIMSDESSLYSWLASVHTYGLTIVNNLGDDDKNITRLAKRVTNPRVTCYGNDFVVKSNPEPKNLAYTGYRLCLHTDLPYYQHEPGIQILHCIQKSEYGGISVFADGFKVAYDLQKEDPETFDSLSTVEISFIDQGLHEISKTDFALCSWKPIIRLNGKGQIQQINFNNHVRGVGMSVGHDNIKEIYRAMKIFNSALYKEENLISFALQEGEAACFNNTRVLHGRSAFTVPPGCQTPRHLQGLFIDWDDIYSRMRGIAAKLK